MFYIPVLAECALRDTNFGEAVYIYIYSCMGITSFKFFFLLYLSILFCPYLSSATSNDYHILVFDPRSILSQDFFFFSFVSYTQSTFLIYTYFSPSATDTYNHRSHRIITFALCSSRLFLSLSPMLP